MDLIQRNQARKHDCTTFLDFGLGGARSSLVVFFFVVLTGVSALAQAGRGSISGTVDDHGGAVLSGADVTLTNLATGVS
jgi:hypothetical protein